MNSNEFWLVLMQWRRSWRVMKRGVRCGGAPGPAPQLEGAVLLVRLGLLVLAVEVEVEVEDALEPISVGVLRICVKSNSLCFVAASALTSAERESHEALGSRPTSLGCLPKWRGERLSCTPSETMKMMSPSLSNKT